MKSYTKEVIKTTVTEQLEKVLVSLNTKINSSIIDWTNAKGEEIACPWSVFNPNGAIKVSREDHPALWDLGRRVQIRCEGERQNAGNRIASFKAVLQAKPNTLSATVRVNGIKRANCPVMDQLAEALSVLSNASKVSRELYDRTEEARLNDELNAEKKSVVEMDAERKAVAADLKARAEVAAKAVKDAFKDKTPEPEGNGQPLVPVGA